MITTNHASYSEEYVYFCKSFPIPPTACNYCIRCKQEKKSISNVKKRNPVKMKEKELEFSDVPNNFLWCIDRQCPKSGTCLRQVAERLAPTDLVQYSIVSPKHIASLGGECPYYCSSTKVQYAKGFLGILENLTAKQVRLFAQRLISNSSRRTYYRVRSGERALSPTEQESILNVLKECGITAPMKFDSYYYDYLWT